MPKPHKLLLLFELGSQCCSLSVIQPKFQDGRKPAGFKQVNLWSVIPQEDQAHRPNFLCQLPPRQALLSGKCLVGRCFQIHEDRVRGTLSPRRQHQRGLPFSPHGIRRASPPAETGHGPNFYPFLGAGFGHEGLGSFHGKTLARNACLLGPVFFRTSLFLASFWPG